jgi:hypothetical protein
MKGNLKIYELKPLKGPDRLLRMHVLIEDTFEVESDIKMLSEIVHSLILNYHGLKIEFPVAELINILPENPECNNQKYGEFLNGVLGLEMIFMRRSQSIFDIRYYAPSVEFERNFSAIDTFTALNRTTVDDYEFKHTLNDLRNGTHIAPFQTKINYVKPF